MIDARPVASKAKYRALVVEDDPAIRRLVEKLLDRKSTRLNSSHSQISYAVFCLKKKKHRKNDARLTPLGTRLLRGLPVRTHLTSARNKPRLVAMYAFARECMRRVNVQYSLDRVP